MEQVPIEKAKISIAIGGLNQNNNIEFHTFSNKLNQKFESFYPTGDDISYGFLESPEMEGYDVQPILQNFLAETGFNTPNKVIKAQKRLNDFVSERDSSVDRVTFELLIRK